MALFRCGGGAKCASGTFVASSSQMTSINCGFKPKYLTIVNTTAVNTRNIVYDERQSTTKYAMSTASNKLTAYNLNDNSAYRLYSIDDNGFTVTKWNNNNCAYFAIG